MPISVSVSSTPSNAASAATDVPSPSHANPRKRTIETESSSTKEQAQSKVSTEINEAQVELQDTASRETLTEPDSLSTRTRSGSMARVSSALKEKGHQESNKSRKPKRKKPGTQEEQNFENAAAEVVAGAVKRSSSTKKMKRHRARREVTPEGAEDVMIVPSEVKMSDLCNDFLTGRKSAREMELEKIQEAMLTQKKQRQLQVGVEEGDAAGQISELGDQRLERLAREKGDREEASRVVPNTVIVDGQIQIDETSLQLDRHAYAAEERDAEQLEGVEESELTRRVNQGSWAKRDKSGSWNEESTDKFYDGLRMFGTDFQMISKLFPGRTRHSVKLKFCKEEKLNKQKISRTLMGERIPVDMEEYSKISNAIYADPRELERELEEDKKRMEAEHAAEKEAMDQIRRQREAEAEAEGGAVVDNFTAQENRDAAQGSVLARGKKCRKIARAKKKSGRVRRGDEGSQEGVLGSIGEIERLEALSADA